MFAVASNPEEATSIWQALADPTRRAMIDLLAAGPLATSAIVEQFAFSRFGVMKHLGVLEAAGVVTSRKHGRTRLNFLNAAPLFAAQERWLSPLARKHARSVAALTSHLEGESSMDENRSSAAIAEVALDWTIRASVQNVWKALFDEPEKWWPREHRAVGDDSVMRFTPELGAQLREESPGGGAVEWYRIYAVNPLRSVDMRGDLASRYGGPATSLLHIELSPGAEDGSTILKLTDSLFGKVGPGTAASVGEGWQAILGGGLVASFE